MILEANERGYGSELARHLLNPRDNDHVSVHAVEGFMADDLFGAFAEAEATSQGTQCQKYLFSLSLNPPPGAPVPVEVFEDTIAEIEDKLGLIGQPRAIVFHEKNGRRHAHCVWSRIDAAQMKAIKLSHYKRKLFDLSRELYLAHDWDMPDGFRKREERDRNNFSRAEAGQAKRSKRDAKALKAMFRQCWEGSDSRAGIEAALKEHGFLLARGERRGFVAVDATGKVWSLSRWCGVKPNELRARLGPEDGLPSIDEVLGQVKDLPPLQQDQPDPRFTFQRAELVKRQRKERDALLDLQAQRRIAEMMTRLPRGLRAAFLKITGQFQKLVAQAEMAAKAALQRDRAEQQRLIDRHLAERRELDRTAQHPRVSGPKRDPLQALVLPQDDLPFTKTQLERNPALVLDHISRTKAQFDRTDVLRVLAKRIDDPMLLSRTADAALASVEAARLPSDGKTLFTTRDYQAAEAQLLSVTQALADTDGYAVARVHIDQAMRKQDGQMYRAFGGRLSEEQRHALQYILGKDQLACVVGLAGAGKSTMLATAADAWRRQGVTVHGAALAGKAADGLEEASGIQSRTLASLEMSWENGYEPIAQGDVLVVDEAGMIGTRQLGRIAAKMNEVGAKLVLVGDPDQLQPIEAGTPFRDVADQIGAARLSEIHRQREDWQKQASRDLADGKINEAVQSYDDNNAVSRKQTHDETLEALVETYAMDTAADSCATRLAFAHRRRDVHALNQAIRLALRPMDDPPPEFMLETDTGKRAFSTGDRIVFGRNDKELGVRNGMLGTVESISENNVSVTLDGNTHRRVSFDPRRYRSFDHGYAVTIHKSQGATVDRSYMLASRSMDRHLAYVAMTRHRDQMRLFVSSEDRPSWAVTMRDLSFDRERPQRAGPSRG